MASSQPEPSQQQRQQMTDDYHKFLYAASLTTCVLAPVIISLPPRKLDLYTFSLASAFIVSANYQLKERTGRGFIARIPNPTGMPQRAEELRRKQQEARALEESAVLAAQKKGSLLEEKAKELWMGGETDGWKERRLREEQEKLENGEGYGSMIMDQIWEVWNWGEKKAEQLEKEDEKVVEKKPR
ncbi:hypothetical protein A1O3_05490 [Capronia epimyces CBS 606.96]|uniref:Rhomboid family membrane protein n=1 Tax=Capronia epimyces CBS 606.96 TaxID=1182542 RepID=W9XW77_9EURO|nr:uncharacterized protein A1O3_05490 [Capronia epimyces CBS 606.96]EXJ84817.1 hypothetical protein A1O3_05490 [Capronia epimyces CBS 606.96]